MIWIVPALLVGGSYLLGSLPFALLLGLSQGTDIRTQGSGNIGATNLGRALGRRWAIAAFVLDYTKGLVPVVAARLLAESTAIPRLHLALACGAAAVLGHVFPLYLRFRGGKGVATTFGAMTGLVWQATLVGAALWAGLYLTTRFVAVASIGAAVCFPVVVWLVPRPPSESSAETWTLRLFAVAVALIILVRHKSNVLRLIRGEEFRFTRRHEQENETPPETETVGNDEPRREM